MNMSSGPCSRVTRGCGSAISYAVSRRPYVAQAGAVCRPALDAALQPRRAGMDERQPVSDRSRSAESSSAGGRTFPRRQDHGLVPVVRHDQPRPGGDRAPGSDQPRLRPRRNITMLACSHGGGWYDPMGCLGNDLGVSMRLVLGLSGPVRLDQHASVGQDGMHDRVHSVNFSRMDLPQWNAKMDAAAKLVGPKRFKVYGQMDLDLMREVAPVASSAPTTTATSSPTASTRRASSTTGSTQDWSIPALALK